MPIGLIIVWLAGCAGWVGDSGVFECPHIPLASVALDETVPGFDLAVEDLPMFAVSPARVQMDYGGGGSTALSVRLEPVQAMVRNARSPILSGDAASRRCEEVVTTFRVEAFSDDGAIDWQNELELVVEDPDETTALSLTAPFAANLGDVDVSDHLASLLAAHPELAPESVRPVAYQLDLDLTDRAPAGSLRLVVLHDPVASDTGLPSRTVTEFLVGTF